MRTAAGTVSRFLVWRIPTEHIAGQHEYHRQEYNKVYRLDAYNKKLVKKINVKGITVKGTTGTDGYLYLEGIDLSQKHYPLARLEFEKKTRSGKNQQ